MASTFRLSRPVEPYATAAHGICPSRGGNAASSDHHSHGDAAVRRPKYRSRYGTGADRSPSSFMARSGVIGACTQLNGLGRGAGQARRAAQALTSCNVRGPGSKVILKSVAMRAALAAAARADAASSTGINGGSGDGSSGGGGSGKA